MKRYSIVWADDEINVLLDDFTKENLDSEGFKIVGQATHSNELDKVLEELCKTTSLHRPDAVIVDANFGKKNIRVEDKMTSGLTHSLSLIEKYSSIPFFLYTKRKEEMLKNIYAEGELEYFETKNRWFEKGSTGFDKLLKRIKQVVEEQATPEFVIRNKYYHEFQIAQYIPGAEATLLKCLLLDMNNEKHVHTVDYFTSLRKIIEGMFDICKVHKVIPEIVELNGCCTFLENKHSDFRIVEGEKIMHESLVYALRYALNVTQDASHNREKLILKTDEYAREVNSNHLFNSVLHITMDLLLWFSKKINTDSELNALRWEKYPILAEVTIEKVNEDMAYGGGYNITINKNIPLREGDVVFIKKSDDKKRVNWHGYSLKALY